MKTKIHRKLFSMILAVCMLCGFVIGNSTPVKAAGDTLPDAFLQLEGKASYNENTGTITLTDDVTLSSKIAIPTGTFIIDLAGYTVTSSKTCFSVDASGVNLTLKDSSVDGAGTVQSNSSALNVSTGSNNITIEGGNYISTGSGQIAVNASLNNANSLNISGGKFLGEYTGLNLTTTGTPKINLTGGVFQRSVTTYTTGGSIVIKDTNGGTAPHISSIIDPASFVSLNGAEPILAANANELNASSYTGTIRIFNAETPNTSQDTPITANVTESPVNLPSYTTTIPQTIDLGDLTKSKVENIKNVAFEVSVANVENMEKHQVNVSISTADGDFNLVNTNDKKEVLPFEVFNQETDGTALKSGDIFASFTEEKTIKGRVDVDQADIKAAGNYTGTITFNIALADRAS